MGQVCLGAMGSSHKGATAASAGKALPQRQGAHGAGCTELVRSKQSRPGRYFGFGLVVLVTLATMIFAVPAARAAADHDTPGHQPADAEARESGAHPPAAIVAEKIPTLTVHVIDQDGYAIVGAWVAGAPDAAKNCKTDKTGSCTLDRRDVQSVVVAAPGFASQQVTPPSDADKAEVTLHVAASMTVQVTANQPAVNAEPSHQRASVQTAEEIEHLPVWLRKVEDLVAITPGAVPRPTDDDLGQGISAAGARTTMTNFVLDGAANRVERRGGVAIRPPLGALAELKILSSGYSAEYGGAPGAQVVMTTKAGSDRFHGEFYNYARDRIGGSLAGPLKRQSTYFLFSYEGASTNYGDTISSSVPKSAWLAGQLQDYPGTISLPSGTPASANVASLPAAMISPMAKALIPLIPQSFSGTLTSEGEHGLDRTLLLRLDHLISNESHITLRMARQRTEQVLQPDMISELPPYWPRRADLSDSSTLSFSKEGSHSALNLHATYLESNGFSLPGCHYDRQFSITLPGSSATPGCPFVSISGYLPFGDAVELYSYHDRHLDSGGDFSIVSGHTTIKLGAFSSNLRYAAQDPAAQNGRLEFDGRYSGAALVDFLLGMPSVAQRDFTTMNKRGVLRGTRFGAYVQDSWRALNSFTLDAGVRLEYRPSTIVPTADFSSFSPLLGAVQNGAGQNLLASQGVIADPRLGFSWAPFGRRTVIRGGIGQYSGTELLSSVLGQLTSTADPRAAAAFVPQSPAINPSAPAWTPIDISVTRGIDSRNFPARIYQYSLTIERELGQTFTVDASFTGSRGQHLGRLYNINMPLPTGGLDASGQPILARTYPMVDDIIYGDQGASSAYHSGMVTLRKRAAAGLSFTLAYTFSKSIDNASSLGNWNWTDLEYAQNIRNLDGERGPSDFDHRHQVSGSLVFQPDHYLQSRAFRNSEVAVVVHAMSGIRYTPLVDAGQFRADIVSDPNANVPPGYVINPAAFTPHIPTAAAPYFFGDAGRNLLVGPYFDTIDTAFNKAFSIKRRCQLKLRMEVFNVLNRRAALVDNTLGDLNFGKSRHYLNEGIHFVGGAGISF